MIATTPELAVLIKTKNLLTHGLFVIVFCFQFLVILKTKNQNQETKKMIFAF